MYEEIHRRLWLAYPNQSMYELWRSITPLGLLELCWCDIGRLNNNNNNNKKNKKKKKKKIMTASPDNGSKSDHFGNANSYYLLLNFGQLKFSPLTLLVSHKLPIILLPHNRHCLCTNTLVPSVPTWYLPTTTRPSHKSKDRCVSQ
jgi:hypothetical protein